MAGKKGMKWASPLDPRAIDRIRHSILHSKIANRLIAHANGERDMSPTEVQAATVLLRKVIPDLSATEHSGSITTFTDFLRGLPEGVWGRATSAEESPVVDPGEPHGHVQGGETLQ